MGVEVRPVQGIQDLRAFIALPYRLHAGTPWIPPLKLERYVFLSRRLNPYFKHGEAEYFLARRDERVVGRITAQIDHAFNAGVMVDAPDKRELSMSARAVAGEEPAQDRIAEQIFPDQFPFGSRAPFVG